MNEQNNAYNNYILTKYYIFAALFQTIWAVAVLGFTIFLVIFFKNYWVLFGLVLVFLKPYHVLEMTLKSDLKQDRKTFGTNNPS